MFGSDSELLDYPLTLTSGALALMSYLSEAIHAGPPEISSCLTLYASAMSIYKSDIRCRKPAVNRGTHQQIIVSGRVRLDRRYLKFRASYR